MVNIHKRRMWHQLPQWTTNSLDESFPCKVWSPFNAPLNLLDELLWTLVTSSPAMHLRRIWFKPFLNKRPYLTKNLKSFLLFFITSEQVVCKNVLEEIQVTLSPISRFLINKDSPVSSGFWCRRQTWPVTTLLWLTVLFEKISLKNLESPGFFGATDNLGFFCLF